MLGKLCMQKQFDQQSARRFFLGLLMGKKMGIQIKWLPTELNKLAGDISRLVDENGDYDYDYSRLIVDYPRFKNCRKFQPSDILLPLILDILLNNASPDPLILKELSPLSLGSHTSTNF